MHNAELWLSFRVILVTVALTIGAATTNDPSQLMLRHVWFIDTLLFSVYCTHSILFLMVF